MTVSNSTVSIQVLDKTYDIRCPRNQIDILQQSAIYLDRRMRELNQSNKVAGIDRIAIVVALNLVQELSDCKRGTEGRLSNINEIIHQLESKIDTALAETTEIA